MPKDNVRHWNPIKADWQKFKHQCSLDINRHSFTDKTGTGSYKPWFNSECKKVTKHSNKYVWSQ